MNTRHNRRKRRTFHLASVRVPLGAVLTILWTSGCVAVSSQSVTAAEAEEAAPAPAAVVATDVQQPPPATQAEPPPVPEEEAPAVPAAIAAPADTAGEKAAASPAEDSTRTPGDILKLTDQARGNLGGVVWEVRIASTTKDERAPGEMFYKVQARGFDFVATTVNPPKYRGQKVLLLSGNMWFYKPDLTKPVPISQRQKLMGHAAYGDIAATNYGEEYDAAPLPDEEVDGEICYVFDLKAKTKKCTYDRIVYRVSKKRLVGVKADYYTVSNKLLKSAVMEYDNLAKNENGEDQIFISKMLIRDELTSASETTLQFSDPEMGDIPAHVFNLNLLMK